MKLNAIKLILGSGPVVKGVLFLLIATSIISWAIIFLKVRLLKRARKHDDEFLEFFWSQRNMETAYRKAKQMTDCPIAAVFRAGYKELLTTSEATKNEAGEISPDRVDDIIENVEATLRRKSIAELNELERRTPFLATTASAAPFIGLFGTVWGIMDSFMNIGETGATNLAVVAPGISEALIATAVGLFAAIPAVIGYNFCQSRIRRFTRSMEMFSSEFLNVLKRQMGGRK